MRGSLAKSSGLRKESNGRRGAADGAVLRPRGAGSSPFPSLAGSAKLGRDPREREGCGLATTDDACG
jgi:hypothetical protein